MAILNNWPEGNLTQDEWLELLAIEYTMTHYPKYYSSKEEYQKECDRLNELRTKRIS